jgi:hypothetical protein
MRIEILYRRAALYIFFLRTSPIWDCLERIVNTAPTNKVTPVNIFNPENPPCSWVIIAPPIGLPINDPKEAAAYRAPVRSPSSHTSEIWATSAARMEKLVPDAMPYRAANTITEAFPFAGSQRQRDTIPEMTVHTIITLKTPYRSPR